MRGGISGQRWFSIAVIAFLLLVVLALCLTSNAASVSAQDFKPAIEQAMPGQSELPPGIEWVSHSDNWAQTAAGDVFSANWQGQDPVPSRYIGYNIFCTIYVTASTLSEKDFRKKILNENDGCESYSQLPGGESSSSNRRYN